MTCGSVKCCSVTTSIIGLVLVVIGGISVFVYDAVFHEVVKQQTSIIPGTGMYKLNWETVAVPIYRNFYVFNVTNMEEFLNQKRGEYVKPVLQQLGPYAYREYLQKDHIHYLDYEEGENQQIYYRQTEQFYFDEERSNGSESDLVTTVNVVAAAVPGILQNVVEPGPTLDLLYITLNKYIEETSSELLFTVPVGDLLFGFKDPLLDKIIDLLKTLGIVPEDLNFEEFGIFMLTNMSTGWKDYQVYTGEQDYTLTNIITLYHNESELPYWYGPTCNTINGTDGTMTPPFMDKTQRSYIFIDEMCRSIYTEYESDYDFMGVKGWKYTSTKELFQSPINNPDNECFCADKNHTTCQHDGAISANSCVLGAPVLISFPHFLYGDGFYVDKLVGMKPDKDDHETFMIYEPITGIVAKTRSRIQLNVFMAPNPNVDVLNQIDEEFAFPVLWLEEDAELTEEYSLLFTKLLYDVEKLFLLIQIILCIIGSCMVIGGIGSYFLCNKNKILLDSNYKLDESSEKEKHPKACRYISTSSTTELVHN